MLNARKILVRVFWLGVFFHLRLWTFMPDHAAIHFGDGGQPNGWSGKDAHLFLVLGLQIFFFLLCYYIPDLTARIPVQWVNLPNREFWFQPEHRAEMRRRLGGTMAWMGILMILFFGYIAYMTLQANLKTPVRLENSSFTTALIFYFAGTGLWLIHFYRTFRKSSFPQ